MMDLFQIFNGGGALLWGRELVEIPGDPVNELVEKMVLEERTAQDRFEHGNYTMRWAFDNAMELIFVAAYLNVSRLPYVTDLIDSVRMAFVDEFKRDLRSSAGVCPLPDHFSPFGESYDSILRKYESQFLARAKAGYGRGKGGKPRSFAETKRGKEITRDQVETRKQRKKAQKQQVSSLASGSDDEDGSSTSSTSSTSNISSISNGDAQERSRRDPGDVNGDRGNGAKKAKVTGDKNNDKKEAGEETVEQSLEEKKEKPPQAQDSANDNSEDEEQLRERAFAERLQKLKSMRGRVRRSGGPRRYKPKSSGGGVQSPSPQKKKKVKKATKWVRQHSEEELAALDFSPSNLGGASAAHSAPKVNISELYEGDSDEDWSDVDMEDVQDIQADGTVSGKNAKSGGGLFGWVKGLVGANELTNEDLEPILSKLKDKLMEKNVATDIAEKLCESVGANLVGKTTGTFQTVSSLVRTALEDALTRILTPKRTTNVLQGIMNAKAAKRPYTIVFIGVNGVGKSTSLAKIAAYFTSKKLVVSVAACDTFRSGAVQQLKTHCTRLGLKLYDRGYDSDAASVAYEAVRAAKKRGDHVVLIDTAGRMQDNAPLMRALSKLINLNNPDLVLFVGEALVGNDGVDQLEKFNQCLVNLADRDEPRLIDGILLTKFDTIDDKVGAAISMTYSSGIPIMFVGVGQDYGDLRKMNVKMLIKKLMK